MSLHDVVTPDYWLYMAAIMERRLESPESELSDIPAGILADAQKFLDFALDKIANPPACINAFVLASTVCLRAIPGLKQHNPTIRQQLNVFSVLLKKLEDNEYAAEDYPQFETLAAFFHELRMEGESHWTVSRCF